MANTNNHLNIEKTLSGMDFPANKQTILSKAKENGAGSNETSVLQKLPEQEYSDAAQVAEALAGTNKGDASHE